MSEFDIAIIEALQSFGEGVLPFMKLVTTLGSSQVLVIIGLTVCWCWNYTFGVRLAALMQFSGILSHLLQMIIAAPRPYMVDERIIAYSRTPGFGMPSGHAQGAAVMWGYLANHYKQKMFWGVAVLMAFLIGISRVYLGVHSLSQVIIGWGIGAALVFVFIMLEHRARVWFLKQSTTTQVISVLGIAVLVMIGGLLKVLSFNDVPEIYDTTQKFLTIVLGGSAFFSGIVIGALILQKSVIVEVKAAWWKQLIKIVIGMLCLPIFIVISHGPQDVGAHTFFVRVLLWSANFLMGLWVTYGAPLLFMKLRLIDFETVKK